jgi:hypothetical protein
VQFLVRQRKPVATRIETLQVKLRTLDPRLLGLPNESSVWISLIEREDTLPDEQVLTITKYRHIFAGKGLFNIAHVTWEASCSSPWLAS